MDRRKEIVRKGYDKIAAEYQADRNVFDNRKELEEFAKLMPRHARILDVGCGAGVPVVKFLVESGFDVTGIDFSESMLEFARRNVPQAKFIRKDMTELDFEEGFFDGLTAFYSLIHVPRDNHLLLLRSFHRILKPNGIMLICLGPDAWEATEEYYGTMMFWSHFSPEESRQLVKKAKFKIIFNKQLTRGGEKHYWILARNKK